MSSGNKLLTLLIVFNVLGVLIVGVFLLLKGYPQLLIGSVCTLIGYLILKAIIKKVVYDVLEENKLIKK